MKVAPVASFKDRLPDFLKLARQEPVFITRNGKIAAVVEGITEDEVEDYLLERSPRFRLALRKAAARSGGVSLEFYRRSRDDKFHLTRKQILAWREFLYEAPRGKTAGNQVEIWKKNPRFVLRDKLC